MKNRFAVVSIIVFSLLITQLANANTDKRPKGWSKLGAKTVAYKLDRDVFKVGPSEGVFTKLKLQVTGGDLNIHKMIIEYANGQKETISLRQRFKRGSGSRVIDLKGNKRVIKDLTFVYDSRNGSNRKAVLHVFGRNNS